MKITIDRIEGNIAVIELEDFTTADVPISLFPNAKEGDKYNIIKDDTTRELQEKSIQDRFNRLKRD